jgi:predicted nucleotidyltransferase
VTAEAGVGGGGAQDYTDGTGPGAAWGDFDDDGDIDLYVTADGPNMLYRNDGDGTFTEISASAGVGAPCNSYGAAWGDYDGDADLDLYVVCHSEDHPADLDHQADEPNLLYRNNGDGTFTDVGPEAGVDNIAHGAGASWVDFDTDGRLDLYVANWGTGDWTVGKAGRGLGERNVLYRNNGDGTFADVTDAAGVGGKVDLWDFDFSLGRGVAAGDYDNDGDIDLYVVKADAPNVLYRNDVGNLNNWLKLKLVGAAGNTGGVGARVQLATDEWRLAEEVRSGSGYLAGNGPECFFGVGELTTVRAITVLWPSGAVQHLRDVPVNRTVTIREPREQAGGSN